MKDAFNGILEVMSGTAADMQQQAMYTGIVRSMSPLTVETSGVLLSGSDLLVNSALLPRTAARSAAAVKGNIKGTCTGCDRGGTTEFSMTEGAITATVTQGGTLSVGCRVAMISSDRNTFVILCKVVGV